MFIDTHVHLDFDQFGHEQDEVVERAAQAGVTHMINVSSSLEGSRHSVELAQRFPSVYAAIGIHPHDAAQVTEENLAELVRLAGRPKVVAVGEIGLDYFKSEGAPELQQQAFEAQMDLARRVGLPIIVHNRDADEDIMALLKKHAGQDGVVHFFSSGLDYAKNILDLALYISFTGVVTFGKERDDVIDYVPLDRVLIETDAPFAAPEPYRGKRCEPAHVVEVARKIAKVKGLSLEEVGRATSANAEHLFGLTERSA